MPSPHIVIVGSCVVDLTTFTDQFPRPGETLFGRNFDLGFGGKGANQAVAARLCGAQASMVGAVGNDLFGPATLENFRTRGVDATHVKTVDGVSSGVAPIFVESSGQNRIVVVTGANDYVLPADVDAAASLFDQAACIVLQLEVPLPTVYHCIRRARERGIRCILNPAPARPLDVAAVREVDWFIPNEQEAESITGIAVHDEPQARRCAHALLAQGFRRVIITLGPRGAFLATVDAMELAPPFAVTAIDTTGAGDAFIGSFAVFLAEGLPEPEAVRRANLYAALSTTRVGTQKSFATREEFARAWASRGERRAV
jgi:ribokinase